MNHESSEKDVALADLRRDYQQAGLDEKDVATDPVRQFERWLHDAIAADVLEPNAMVLATVGSDGRPAVRTVLLKGCDARGFVFFTNYKSRKARHLATNARAALLFMWLPLARQVEIGGTVTRVERAETESYFQSRPRASQLGAWASQQSAVLPERAMLEQRVADLEKKYAGKTITTPPHWGGYRLVPDSLEFWQGRPSRLHDRLRYTRKSDGTWTLERLSP